MELEEGESQDKLLNIIILSLLLHRAFCRITLIITPTNALTKNFPLKHLKTLQHVSILRSTSRTSARNKVAP